MMNQVEKALPSWLSVTATHAVVTLSRPSEANGVQVDTVTLRSPTLREERAADRAAQGDAEQRELMLFAGLTEMGLKDIEGLKLLDYHRLQEGYSRLVPQLTDPTVLPPWLSVAADNVQVTLSCPSEVSSVKLDVLNLRSPTVREVRAADRAANGNAEQRELTLFAELTGASISDLEGLKLVDYYRLQAGYFRLVHDDGV
ncbi:phage tail assembly protein [Pseudomonas frederiksbergensis]|uniref:Phage tail assembly protein n=1 Tax=Pseudomonas frederiksbergensis TaxID=104087 RepID=A0A6L5C336_9PSED|nr:hypothetical protein FX983_03381 [Pseudomonas frederiksbergensis]